MSIGDSMDLTMINSYYHLFSMPSHVWIVLTIKIDIWLVSGFFFWVYRVLKMFIIRLCVKCVRSLLFEPLVQSIPNCKLIWQVAVILNERLLHMVYVFLIHPLYKLKTDWTRKLTWTTKAVVLQKCPRS